MPPKEFLTQQENNLYVNNQKKIEFSKELLEQGILKVPKLDREVYSVYSKIQILSPAMLHIKPQYTERNKSKSFDEKAFATTGDRNRKEGLFKLVHQIERCNNSEEPEYWKFIDTQKNTYLDPFELWTPQIDRKTLLPHSLFLQFRFTLVKPFISRDDESFYIIENPVKKEKVFKVPMMAASGWKGNLRWAAGKHFVDELPAGLRIDTLNSAFDRRLGLIRVFGNENAAISTYFNRSLAAKIAQKELADLNENDYDDKTLVKSVAEKFQHYVKEKIPKTKEVSGVQGRLYFYPTFFDRIDLDVINPHNRTTRSGKNPIYIEVVPEKAEGVFSLLWMPFDLIGDRNARKKALRNDWTIIRAALRDVLLTYGFSAKKTSGYGIIRGTISEARCTIGGTSVNIYDEAQQGLRTFFDTITNSIEEIAHG